MPTPDVLTDAEVAALRAARRRTAAGLGVEASEQDVVAAEAKKEEEQQQRRVEEERADSEEELRKAWDVEWVCDMRDHWLDSEIKRVSDSCVAQKDLIYTAVIVKRGGIGVAVGGFVYGALWGIGALQPIGIFVCPMGYCKDPDVVKAVVGAISSAFATGVGWVSSAFVTGRLVRDLTPGSSLVGRSVRSTLSIIVGCVCGFVCCYLGAIIVGSILSAVSGDNGGLEVFTWNFFGFGYCGLGAPIGAVSAAIIYSSVDKDMAIFAAALEGRAVQQDGRRGWGGEGRPPAG
jgi:hypothetical protein